MRHATLKRLYTLVFSAAMLLLSSAAFADGILVPGIWPDPRPDYEPIPAFSVKYHHVDVSIEDQAARTRIDQVFKNESDRRIEGTYIFPIPEDAALKDFSMWIGNEKVKGDILDAAEARRIYEDIVRKMKDPALLEYLDRGIFRARVFPIEPHEEKRIQLEYVQLNHFENSVYRYTYPLNTEKFSSKPLESVRVAINLHSKKPLRNIYCPTHNVSIRRDGEFNADISFEQTNVRPDADMTIYYSTDDKDVGLNLLTFREPGDPDGFFLLLAAPKTQVLEKEIAAKDVVMVFDRTGSMSGEKIDQAREALKFCIRTLNAKDRFNVIAFNETPDPLFKGLMKVDKTNIDAALKFADGFDATGSTNINDALLEAMNQMKARGGKNPGYILFLTDGLPTIGVMDDREIMDNVKKGAAADIRLFAFGVGYDVNTRLLDGLTVGHRGAPEYVRPGENIEASVSGLFRKISFPVLGDLSIDWGGMRQFDVFPTVLPDLFKGSQLILAGRYHGAKKTAVTLAGIAGDKKVTFKTEIDPGKSDPLNDFIPFLWAQRKIAFLIDEIRAKGSNKELVDEIIRLSKKYGIITEYTAFLVTEPGMITADAEEQYIRVRKKMDVAADNFTGGAAVNTSINMQNAGKAAQAPAAVQSYYNETGEQVFINQVKNVSGRIFFQQGDNWLENTFELTKDKEPLKVQAFSEAYFQIVGRDPEVGKLMAVGQKVLVVLNGQAVQFDPKEGKQTLTEAELFALVP